VATPPIVLKPPSAIPSIAPARGIDGPLRDVTSATPLPAPASPLAPVEPDVPAAAAPPAPPPPPLIPAGWVAPAAAGGGVLLLLAFFGSKLGGRKKRHVVDAPRFSSRVVSDGRADQALSVKWKRR
jgi:hypothetical protein